MFEQLLAIATALLLFILLYASTATNISKKHFRAIAFGYLRMR